jgi:hypothetical protein
MSFLGYKNSVHTSQETYYVSSTEPSQLIFCKIGGCHGGDYEECRLLGYKTPVRTSQETHYVSATELSRFILCKIGGFHGGYYEELRLLERGIYSIATSNVIPSSSILVTLMMEAICSSGA